MSVVALDPFGARSDPSMPVLRSALDAGEVERRLANQLSSRGRLAVRAIRVVRHKPGRRCLIEYDVDVGCPGRMPERQTLVGKVRPRGADTRTFGVVQALWRRGFDAQSADGISVPEPLATVPELGLWLQRKVDGAAASALLGTPDGVALARRLAEAAHKVHRAGVASRREHTMADELRILRARLDAVARLWPEWAARLERLLGACDRVGGGISSRARGGIHRDFYADQTVVDGRRLYLLDFDLYCDGDPALDVGNCIGHITEQSLRACGDPLLLADREEALEERFVELAGLTSRAAVRAYTLLTLARHVALSTEIAERRWCTASLLELCEERLGLAGRGRARPPTATSRWEATGT